jgi:hypothetical protein
MHSYRTFVAAIAAIGLIASCGAESPSSDSVSTISAPRTTSRSLSEVSQSDDTAPSTRSYLEVPPTGESPVRADVPQGSQTVQLDQPAIWPASDVVLGTPEQAAKTFVSDVLGVEPMLSNFLAGDSRSGEIQVFSPGDVDGADVLERGLLGLRIIGPNDGWFVIGAVSPGVSIDSPETLDRVAAGPLTVTGEGRGFEGTLVVTAFRAGDADDVLGQVITRGGAFETRESFTVSIDLSDASPGEVIALIVRGDTGLDGDPGDFASIPVVIDDPLPETR